MIIRRRKITPCDSLAEAVMYKLDVRSNDWRTFRRSYEMDFILNYRLVKYTKRLFELKAFQSAESYWDP